MDQEFKLYLSNLDNIFTGTSLGELKENIIEILSSKERLEILKLIENK